MSFSRGFQRAAAAWRDPNQPRRGVAVTVAEGLGRLLWLAAIGAAVAPFLGALPFVSLGAAPLFAAAAAALGLLCRAVTLLEWIAARLPPRDERC